MRQETPAILFDFKKNRIRIHKNTLRALNNPSHVLLLVNPINKLVAVKGNDGTDARAHRVTQRISPSQSFEIYSSSLLHQLRQCIEWSDSSTYRILGNRVDNQDLVQFSINESFPFPDRDVFEDQTLLRNQ